MTLIVMSSCNCVLHRYEHQLWGLNNWVILNTSLINVYLHFYYLLPSLRKKMQLFIVGESLNTGSTRAVQYGIEE